MKDKRQRVRQEFWLDISKSEDVDILHLIADLKRSRSFSQVVRAGLRLVVDLWNGNLTVLLELFPWVEEAFFQRLAEQRPPETSAIQDQLSNLERILLAQGSQPTNAVAASGNAKPLKLDGKLRPLEVPDWDDEPDVPLVIKHAVSKGDAAQNFLNSAFKLVQ